MKRAVRLTVLLVVSGVVLGLRAPTHAGQAGGIAFTGRMFLSTPLTYPGIGPQRTANFNLNSDVCVDAFAVKRIGAGECHLGLTGTVSGYCGLTTATGSGTYTDALSVTHTLTFVWTATGGAVTLTGTAVNATTGQSGPITGVFTMVNTRNCTTGAVTFDVAGELAYHEL